MTKVKCSGKKMWALDRVTIDEEYTSELKDIDSAYNKAINKFAMKIYRNLVVPFCKKYRLNFVSGMGTFVFRRRDKNNSGRMQNLNTPEEELRVFYEGRHIKSHNSEKWERYCMLYEILLLQPDGYNCPIGAYMLDYPMPKK